MIADIGNALSTYSQLALGLAGFSSVLIALSGKPSSWTRVDSFRITVLLASSFLAVLISLLPPTLALFSISDASLWRISLGVLALATLAIVLLAVYVFRRMPVADRAVLRVALVYGICSLLVVSGLIEAYAGICALPSAAAVFFAGLVVLFAFSIYLIIRFLFARPTD